LALSHNFQYRANKKSAKRDDESGAGALE